MPVLVGQHRRHNPFVNKAKEIIESGELGKLTVSSFHYMIYKNDEYFDVEWHRKKGAGPILVNLVHDVDLLRYLLGEPVAVQGMQSSAARGFETEDSAVVNVRFADGTLASMTISDATASPGTGRPPLARIRSTVPSTPTPTLLAAPRTPCRCPPAPVLLRRRLQLAQAAADGDSGRRPGAAAQDAAQALCEGRPPRGRVRRDPADNVKTLTLLNAIKEAAETVQLVELQCLKSGHDRNPMPSPSVRHK